MARSRAWRSSTSRISNPTLADELAERQELEAVLAKIDAARATETDNHVQEDLEILRKAFDLQFREEDFGLQHEVPFINASEQIFEGLRSLLDDQVAADRRPAALVRLRKYAGMEPGYKPFTELLKQRELEQIAKPGVIYPSKDEVQTELGRNSNYVDGIADSVQEVQTERLGATPTRNSRTELADYDAWVRANILPKARTDFRLPPEKYALELRGVRHRHSSGADRRHGAHGLYVSTRPRWRRWPRRSPRPTAILPAITAPSSRN